MWTDRQRGALMVVTAGVLVLLLVRYLRQPELVPDPLPVHGARAHELPGRIDPNTADLPTLMALPVIGESLGKRIIEDREAFARGSPGVAAYQRLEDLGRVKGIGDATLKTLEPYLVFPERPETP